MIPSRTILSVPGHMAKMHAKAAAGPADVVMLDLEDSVPPDQKEEARTRIIASLRDLDFGHRHLMVRTNGLSTPFAYRDLIDTAEACGPKITAFVLPKVEEAGDIHFADRLLTGIEAATGLNRHIELQASIETARGLNNVSAIAGSCPRLNSLVFGIADYTVSVGAGLASLSGHGEKEEKIYPGHRWHFPLSRMVMAAKANDLLAIDAPFGNFRDPEGLAASARMARALGCDGKWVIHPDQIPTVNKIFTPSASECRRAEKILTAVAAAPKKGLGAVAVDGRMIDQATLRLARQIRDQARALNLDLGLDLNLDLSQDLNLDTESGDGRED